jgi:SAM-dependent methyltransferase
MMDKKAPDLWVSGDPYEQYVGRWSRKVAPEFLAWLQLPSRLTWLDVGCGTGALSAAILDRCSPAAVTGVEPSAGFLAVARKNLGERVALHEGDASRLPLGDGSVDVVVSGLVLNFIPDPHAALREMARVANDTGVIAAYVWDYSGKMELMQYFWDAAVELDPAAAKLTEGAKFRLCRPDALEELFTVAGLNDVQVQAIDIATPFPSFDAYWQPFLGGQGPAPAYTMSLPEPAREQLREKLRSRLPTQPDGGVNLAARAWAVRGSVDRHAEAG